MPIKIYSGSRKIYLGNLELKSVVSFLILTFTLLLFLIYIQRILKHIYLLRNIFTVTKNNQGNYWIT